MTSYAFWNNKGGTGKTSLAFQAICRYAELHPNARVLAIDLCPQANLSELFLGGLVGGGSNRLLALHQQTPRQSIGGYFQLRLPSPYTVPTFNPSNFIVNPGATNLAIPRNIDLVPGDGLVELQANAIATLANTQIPGTNTWLAVINWARDFVNLIAGQYAAVFLDSNPSFSTYTQIALAATDRLVLPVMADDSSRRAIENAFSLVHGINLPSPAYAQYAFHARLQQGGQQPPLMHLFVKNRLTQYMGPASAYHSVLTSIDDLVRRNLQSSPQAFTFSSVANAFAEVRDFQTTGVVAFAEGIPFSRLTPGYHNVLGRRVQVNQDYIQYCMDAVNGIVHRL